jgi:hypothetical protein
MASCCSGRPSGRSEPRSSAQPQPGPRGPDPGARQGPATGSGRALSAPVHGAEEHHRRPQSLRLRCLPAPGSAAATTATRSSGRCAPQAPTSRSASAATSATTCTGPSMPPSGSTTASAKRWSARWASSGPTTSAYAGNPARGDPVVSPASREIARHRRSDPARPRRRDSARRGGVQRAHDRARSPRGQPGSRGAHARAGRPPRPRHHRRCAGRPRPPDRAGAGSRSRHGALAFA